MQLLLTDLYIVTALVSVCIKPHFKTNGSPTSLYYNFPKTIIVKA